MLVPLTISCIAWIALTRCCRATCHDGQRYALAMGVVCGFAASCFCWSWFPFEPQSQWHWLPYLAAFAALLLGAAQAEGIHWPERTALMLVVAISATAILLPDFAELEPSRFYWLVGISARIWILLIAGELLATRFPD
jgi:hypothetical protein